MKYAHYLLTEAIGKVLSETIEVNDRRFLKGKKLTIDDVDVLKSKGLRTIFAAEPSDNDVEASTVLGMIAARLCGKNTAYTIGDSGLCKIISTTNGVLQREDERVAKFNHKHKHFILNTVPAWKQVKSGEVIAELELTAPAISQEDVDEMLLYLSGNTALISVNDSYPRKTAFVYVGLSDSPEENAHFTAQVAELIQNFSALELKFEGEYRARYDIESVADEIQSAENAGYEFIDFWRMDEDTLSRVRWYTPFPESERNFIGHAVNKTCRNIQKACGSGINGDVDFKCGSQWFSITDEMARYVISQEEWLWKTFGHTIICDEIFLATLAAASPLRDRLYRNPDNPPEVKASRIRLIDWTRGESIRHPWTFRAGDFEMLMNAPQFWARKFDEKVDSEIIDRVCGAVRNAKDGGTEA